MSDNTKAVLLALLATGFYACVSCMAKLAVQDFHVLQVLFFRQIVVFLSTLPTLLRDLPNSLKTEHPFLHAIRLIASFFALSLGIWAVQGLPLTIATALHFTGVFFVAIMGGLFLDEHLGKYKIAAIGFGFIGMLIITRPNLGGMANIFSLIALGSTLGGAIATLTVRKLSQTETTATLLAYQAIFIGIIAGIPMFWLWKQPTLFETGFLLSMGCLSCIGQWIGIKALRLGQAGIVKSMDYASLLYASILGYAVFGEKPDQYTIFGAIIIVLSGLAIIHGKILKKRPLKGPSANTV